MQIGCTGNFRKKEYYHIIDKIHRILNNKDIKVYLSSDFSNEENNCLSNQYHLLDFPELVNKSDIIFAIGGDGTILSTARRIGKKMKPIMGIHIGGLGFLSECTEDNLEKSIQAVLDNKYKISKRMLLECWLDNKREKNKKLYALNDIVVDHGASKRMLKIILEVSGHYLNTFEGDGVIVSTSTGSTAYSLSAGGPIIYPSMDAISITPVCPHSLSARPIVLNGNEKIQIKFPETENKIAITIDGQITIPIDYKTKIQIQKSEYCVELIKLPNSNYFKTLRTKMGWIGNVR